MQTSSTKQSSMNSNSPIILNPDEDPDKRFIVDPKEAVQVIKHYAKPENGMQFILKECKTLKVGKPSIITNLPNTPHIRDLARLFFWLPPGKALVLGKSRQMQATWVACSYVVWCLLFKRNFNIVWSSLKQEHAAAVLDRIKQIMDHLSIPVPQYYKTASHIKIPALNNSIRAVPRGDTQITSFAYNLWIADEFAKIQPARLQDKIFREAMPALQFGQVFFISSAYPDCLFESMYLEK